MIGDGTAKYSNAQGLLLVVDTVAMIQCRPLFRLKGDSVRQCGYTGWSGNPSYCERKKLFHYETIIFKAKKYFPPPDNIYIYLITLVTEMLKEKKYQYCITKALLT